MAAGSGEIVLALRDVAKSFGPVVALRSGRIEARAGSIHALVGENGAGKSTLVKIVAGVHRRDTGEFLLGGEDGRLPTHRRVQGRRRRRDLPGAHAVPGPLGHREHLHGPPAARPRPAASTAAPCTPRPRRCSPGSASTSTRAGPRAGLSIADQQILEIAKAISLDARLLIMDEPTAALSGVEVERLFAVARSLRDEGRALIFISHRFDEVFGLCDTVTVMRDGAYVATVAHAETSVDAIVEMMVGREVGDLFPKTPAEIGEPVLEVEGLSSHRRLPRRQLRGPRRRDRRPRRPGRRRPQRGGPGRLRRRLATTPAPSRVAGKAIPKHNPTRGDPARHRASSRRTAASRAWSPRPRWPATSPAWSAAGWARSGCSPPAPRAAPPARGPPGSRSRPAPSTSPRPPCPAATSRRSSSPSGWPPNPQLLIIDEPTRGIDVGTKAEVHRLLSELAGQGMAILMISSELPEVLGMADRVLVLCEGRLTADIPRERGHARGRHEGRHPTARRPPHERPAPGPARSEHERRRAARRAEQPSADPARFDTVVRSREMSILLRAGARRSRSATIKSPSFLFSADCWRDLLLTPSILLLLAVGQAVVIITRNVDLSVGSVLGLHGVPHRPAVHRPPGPADRRGRCWPACCSAPLLGLVNGLLVAIGKVPALVITLGTLYIYRGIVLSWAGSDRINAGDMPDDFLAPGHQVRARHPGATFMAVGRARRRRLLPALLPRRPRALRDRLRPGRRRALRPAGPPPGDRRLRPQRRPGRAGRRPLHRPLRHRQLRRRHRHRAAGGGRRGHRRRRDLRRQRHGAGAPRSAPMLLVTIDRALPILGIPDFWQRAVVGGLILGAIVLDRVLSAAPGPQARRSEGRVMSTPPSTAPTSGPHLPGVLPPLWRRCCSPARPR